MGFAHVAIIPNKRLSLAKQIPLLAKSLFDKNYILSAPCQILTPAHLHQETDTGG